MAQGLGGHLEIRVGDCVLLLSLPQPPHGWSGSLMLAPFPDGRWSLRAHHPYHPPAAAHAA